jgi:hypothetical protein
MKNVIGELVKETKNWQRSPRVRGVCNVTIDQRTKDTPYDICIMGVKPQITTTYWNLTGTGPNVSTDTFGPKEIDTVFKNFEDNTSWEDHVVWIKPSFTCICTDQIKYEKKNQVKFLKLLLPDNTEAWVHANDVEIV